MTVATQVVEVTLPLDASPTDEELERLRAALQAVTALHFERPGAGHDVQRGLEAEGWKVSLHFAWCAEARRGRDYESAVGGTREEALESLRQLTRLDVPPGGV